MSERVVVVLGSSLTALGDDPYFHDVEFLEDPRWEQALSIKEYGNHLDQLWSIARKVSQIEKQKTSFDFSVLNPEWAVVTNDVSGRVHDANLGEVVEVDGNLRQAKCLRCGTTEAISDMDLEAGGVSCTGCGKNRIRPYLVLRGEKPFGHRRVDALIKDSTRTVFIGVDPESAMVDRWRGFATASTLVSPEPWGGFTRIIGATPQEWVAGGCVL